MLLLLLPLEHRRRSLLTQIDIAQKIIAKKADYVLALKLITHNVFSR
jgi:hypothetical protein